MSATALHRQFDAAGLAGDASLAARRREALQQFLSAGFPTRRHEDWRYTDLKALEALELDLRPAPPEREREAEIARVVAALGLEAAAPTLVFVDGVLTRSLSEMAVNSDLVIQSLWDHLPNIEPQSLLGNTPLANLNLAFAEQGAYVHAPRGLELDVPVQLVFVGIRDGIAPQPRVMIDLDRGARLTVTQHFVDLEDQRAASWLNIVTQVQQASESKLTLYRLQEHAQKQFHTSVLRAELARGAELSVGYFDLGGRLVRNDVDIVLTEPESSVALRGLYVASDGQHIDDHLRVDHAAPSTRSLQEFRGIIGAGSRGVFNGKVIVRKDAQRIDAEQRNDNLLLADDAEINTKPELEIYADDVKCSHGATVGELDEHQLFYLRTRGIDEDAARGLLTQAFAQRSVSAIGLAGLAERVFARVAGRLPDQALIEALV